MYPRQADLETPSVSHGNYFRPPPLYSARDSSWPVGAYQQKNSWNDSFRQVTPLITTIADAVDACHPPQCGTFNEFSGKFCNTVYLIPYSWEYHINTVTITPHFRWCIPPLLGCTLNRCMYKRMARWRSVTAHRYTNSRLDQIQRYRGLGIHGSNDWLEHGFVVSS